MLWQRFKTAVVALAIILVVLFVAPRDVTLALVALIVAAAAWEWGPLASIAKAPGRAAYVAFIMVCAASLWFLLPQAWYPQLFYAVAAWWLLAFVLVLRYPFPVPPPLAFFAGAALLAPAFFSLGKLLTLENGAQWTLFVLVVIWGADVGAYFSGKALGRRKLAPRVSPKKTWEGVAGGLVVCALVGVAGVYLFGLAWYRLVPLCVLTGLVSVVGDLAVSLFKRNAGVKDSGTLFPGHGGVLDRIDSLTIATPFFVAAIMYGHGPW
jgi:phosphatidate cytidylyltransferase